MLETKQLKAEMNPLYILLSNLTLKGRNFPNKILMKANGHV